jgi:multiple antibiotic resistance protein
MNETDLIKAFGAFFAIMNPFVTLPIFLALTAGFTIADQRKLAVQVTIYSAIMCAVILIGGQQIIAFFGITIDQFRVAGGAVLASIAWSMLNGAPAPSHQGSPQEQAKAEAAKQSATSASDISGMAFFPLTFPMVVGPGTIATLIIYAGHAKGMEGLGGVGAVVALILVLLFLVLFFASAIGKVLSETARVITTRLMGMILLSIAVEMIVAGLTALLPGLAGGAS